jgi:1-acyl-sn-glycerol-3-phosphate acyltransferase
MTRTAHPIYRWLYPAWAWCVLAILAPVAWIAAVLAPSERAAWRALHLAARLALWATRTPVAVRGPLPAPPAPVVLVSNHASYLDVLVLMAVLPWPVGFVAKAELGRSWFAGPPLRRIGTLFVERSDRRRGLIDYRLMAASARLGRSMLLFPEGTFGRRPGLLPFHMGAFVTAVAAGIAVVPIALKGTRAILPSGSRWPRYAPVEVWFGAPMPPAAGRERWAAATALRDQARQWIAAHCGEADLAAPVTTPGAGAAGEGSGAGSAVE